MAKEAAEQTEPNAEKMAEANAYEQAIIASYDTEEERELARQTLSEIEGIDFKDGMDDDSRVDKVEEETRDETKAAKDDSEAEPEAGEKADPEPGAEADEEVKAAEEDETESAEADTEKDETIAALQKQLAEQGKQIAELNARQTMSQTEKEIRDTVSKETKQALDSYESEQVKTEERLRKYEEEYGKEAADVLRAEVREKQDLRKREIEREADEKINRLRAEKQAEVDQTTSVEALIASDPDLSKWRDDYRANMNGDSTKSDEAWHLAVSIDTSLRNKEEWKGKSEQDRFTEVVRRVKQVHGAESAGTPEASSKKAGKEETKESVRKKVADEIAKQALGKDDDPPITSMTDITGGDDATEVGLDKIGNMDMTDIAGLGLSQSKIDSMLANPDLYN